MFVLAGRDNIRTKECGSTAGGLMVPRREEREQQRPYIDKLHSMAEAWIILESESQEMAH